MGVEVFQRAAYYLIDYADVYDSCIIGDASFPNYKENVASRDEMLALAKRLKELCGEWEKRRAFGEARNAAEILRDMLKDWQVPGAVWYCPRAKRFRLVGDGYEPKKGELCVGVYLPNATAPMIEADIKDLMSSSSTRN